MLRTARIRPPVIDDNLTSNVSHLFRLLTVLGAKYEERTAPQRPRPRPQIRPIISPRHGTSCGVRHRLRGRRGPAAQSSSTARAATPDTSATKNWVRQNARLIFW
jgi:hypothetical protein